MPSDESREAMLKADPLDIEGIYRYDNARGADVVALMRIQEQGVLLDLTLGMQVYAFALGNVPINQRTKFLAEVQRLIVDCSRRYEPAAAAVVGPPAIESSEL